MLKTRILIAGLTVVVLIASAVALWFPGASDTPSMASRIGAEKLAYLDSKRQKKNSHPKRYDKPKEALQFYAEKRAPVGSDRVPVEQYAPARAQMSWMPRFSASKSELMPSLAETNSSRAALAKIQSWQELGPGNVGGRTRTLVINPKKPRVMYIAGVAGGVWRSTNQGGTWSALDDLMANLAVTTLAMNPGNPKVLYAGTGEGFFNSDALRGDGIFKTTNGGNTWKQLPRTANNPNFHYVNKLVVSTRNPRTVYAATRTGVWRSKNGGKSWRQTLIAQTSTGCVDLVVRTNRKVEQILVSCGSFERATVYRSGNAGTSFQPVLSEPGMGRTALAIAPSKQRIMYALAASSDQTNPYFLGLHAVFLSKDGGKTWKATVRNTDANKLNTLLLTNTLFANYSVCRGAFQDSFFNQGWYDNVIAVDPKNHNIVWAGGIDLFRSANRGKSWGVASYWWDSDVPTYVHADQHAIVFHPKYNGKTNRTAFVTNDGGIYRTRNARANVAKGRFASCDPGLSKVKWDSLSNNYAVTQFYHGLSYPGETRFFGGTQDNGTIRRNVASGPNAWREILGGDGGYVAVDPTNTDIVFAENTRLSIQKSTDGGFFFDDATLGILEDSRNFLFINAFLMDPNNPQRLWTGGTSAWRTDNQASTWTQASAAFMTGFVRGLPNSFSAWAVAATDSDYVAGGTRFGDVFTTTVGSSVNSTSDVGRGWTSDLPTPGFVSSLAFDPKDKNVLYATYSTFGVDHVWRRRGGVWSAVDKRDQAGGIPDIPVHTIAIDPDQTNRLFVGTDLGVFASTDGGRTWAVENTGFANTVVEHLQIVTGRAGKQLYAFTHGRGSWKTKLAP